MSLVIREFTLKPSPDATSYLVEGLKLKRMTTQEAGGEGDVEDPELSDPAGRNVKWGNHFEKHVSSFPGIWPLHS